MAAVASQSSDNLRYIAEVIEPLVNRMVLVLLLEKPQDPERFLLNWLHSRCGQSSGRSSHVERGAGFGLREIARNGNIATVPSSESRLRGQAGLNGCAQLFEAAKNDDVEDLMKSLDRCGQTDAMLTARDESFSSLLHVALMNGATNVVEYILSQSQSWRSRLTYEYNLQGQLLKRTISAALNCRDGRGKSPLSALCSSELPKLEIVVALLEANADPAHQDSAGTTPFIECASSGHVEVGKILLHATGAAALADADARGRGPLHSAAQKGHIHFVELILSCGAITDAIDNEGRMPLDLARDEGHEEICKLLTKGSGSENEASYAMDVGEMMGEEDFEDIYDSVGMDTGMVYSGIYPSTAES